VKYTLENGKVVNIPDSEIEKNMKLLEISKEEAVEMWLCDNDFEDNEELEELDTKAKKVKVVHGAGDNKRKKSEKPRTVKVSDAKKELFSQIFANLTSFYANNATILKENKLISVKIGEKTFKIDIIEQRAPKK
jgi:predicted phosphodiesterase